MENYCARPPAQKPISPVAEPGSALLGPVPDPRVSAAEQTDQDTTPVGLAAMMAYARDIHARRTPTADGRSLGLWLPTPGLIELISNHAENMSTVDSRKTRDQGIQLFYY